MEEGPDQLSLADIEATHKEYLAMIRRPIYFTTDEKKNVDGTYHVILSTTTKRKRLNCKDE